MLGGTQGGSLNKEVEWRPWFSGTQGEGSLNIEVEWRPWLGGTQGGSVNKGIGSQVTG